MEYIFEDNFYNEDCALEASDREHSDEDKIDSDVEVALYSQIHYVEHESREVFQANVSTESKINTGNNSSYGKSETLSSTIWGDIKNPITLSSDTSSDSDEVKVLSEVKPASSDAPDVIVFDYKDNVNDESVKRKRNLCEEFVSIAYSDNEEKAETFKFKVKNDNFVSNALDISRSRRRFFSRDAKETNTNTDSDSSEDLFKYPTNAKDNISINVSSDSSEKFEEYNGRLWYVNHQDLYPEQVSRYYNRNTFMVCRICGERGHKMKDCQRTKNEVACFLCGRTGHFGRRCPTGTCEKCFSVKHRTKKCRVKDEVLEMVQSCKVCFCTGHQKTNCPDFWRRYHLTRGNNPIVFSKRMVNKNVYCYNCGKRGHFGHLCYEPRMSENTFATNPFIMNYNSPFNKDKCKVKKKKDTPNESVGKTKKKKKKQKRMMNEAESPSKCLHNMTDYVNLLHLPKEKAKSRKKRSARRANRLLGNVKFTVPVLHS